MIILISRGRGQRPISINFYYRNKFFTSFIIKKKGGERGVGKGGHFSNIPDNLSLIDAASVHYNPHGFLRS